MTEALEGGEWSAALPGRTLTPGKTRYPFYRRLGGPQGRSERAENLVPTGIRSRTVQSVVSRYTDWATRPTHTHTHTHTHTYTHTHMYIYIFFLRMISSYFSYMAMEMRFLWSYLWAESRILNMIQACGFLAGLTIRGPYLMTTYLRYRHSCHSAETRWGVSLFILITYWWVCTNTVYIILGILLWILG